MKRKSQVAMEYVFIVGFATLLAIPLFLIFSYYSNEARDEVAINQADSIARKIVDSAESVYYLGEPSKVTLKVYMPNYVDDLTIEDGDVHFVVKTGFFPNDIVHSSDINISGNVSFKPGLKIINIEAKGDYVWVYT